MEVIPPTQEPTEMEMDETVALEIPAESYFCGHDWDDASERCTDACPTKSDEECPDDQKCFPYTPCTKPESFFCGTSFDDATSSCTLPCPTGKSKTCPSGSSCFAYTTCKPITTSPTEKPTDEPSKEPTAKPTPGPTAKPTNEPTAEPTEEPSPSPTNKPTPPPSRHPTQTPTEEPTPEPTPLPTRYPTQSPTPEPTNYPTRHPTNEPSRSPTRHPTEYPTKSPSETPTSSPIIPVVVEVKSESFYCGMTFDHASSICGVPCPDGPDDCPPGLKCFGNTPCGDRSSFFCGVSYSDANQRCTQPCEDGSADSCPGGQSCFAFTMCKPITEEPTDTPTKTPTRKPTKEPTPSPTDEPTPGPTPSPTKATPPPTPSPTKATPPPTESPTTSPTKKATPSPTTPAPTTSEPTELDLEETESSTSETPKEPSEPQEEETEEPTEPEEETEAPAEEEEETEEPTEAEEETEEPTEPEEETEEPTEPEEETEPPAETEEETEEPTEPEEPTQPPTEAETDEPVNMIKPVVIELKECEDPLAMTVNQAYWRSWSSDRPETCNKFEASDIDASTYTHLVYSFASISSEGLMEPWVGSWDEVEKYKEFNKVKERNPDVKTVIAVTEGVFYGAGMNPVTFNEVAESDTTRIAFAQSVVSFLSLYEFDGVDIDWDSPLDSDQGGSPDNYERFVELVKEIRTAIDDSGKDYTLTVALPPTEYELIDYDVIGLSEYVDWFNLMTFDYHTPKNIPKTVGAHSDLKLIDYIVNDLLQDTASTKFTLGMAAYGRTYTLADDRCHELGCPFRSPGLGGCGKTPGFLPFNEISEYIESGSYDELYHDISSSSMVAVVDEDQMISFDDETTFAIKEAYAEMMCLRGTMLWSIDMFKAPTDISPAKRSYTEGARMLSDTTPNEPNSIGLTGGDLLGCNLCGNRKVYSSNTVEYAGSEVKCSELESMLTTVFVPQDTDECSEIHSKYSTACCTKTPSKGCDICESTTDVVLLEDREVQYSGSNSKCGELYDSLKLSTEEASFTCSLAKTSLNGLCCAESCQICSDGRKMNTDGIVDLEGEQVSCMDYELSLKKSGIFKGSDQCDSSVSSLSDLCCVEDEEVRSSAIPPPTPCNICQRGAIHHELKAEAFVEYKGASLSCVDVNSILSKSENEGSEMCEATQSSLFDGCCYEKCTLCGDRALKYDATVKYNKQILSCDEFSAMFSMSVTREGSEQCDAIQSAYSSTCCFKPPTTPCNLCKQGSMAYNVVPNAFVKNSFSSSHCVNIFNALAEREEEGSQTCKESQSSYFEKCCDSLSKVDSNYDNSYYQWLADYMTPQSSGGIPNFHGTMLWRCILLTFTLLGIFLSC
jgi:chitinase